MWGWDRNQEVRVWHGVEKGRIMQIALSPDNRRLASTGGGFEDTAIRVWEARTGKELFRCKGLRSSPMCVAFSPDGKYLAAGSVPHPEDHEKPGEVKLWDATTGEEKETLDKDRGAWRLAFSPDGAYLAWTTLDDKLHFWDLKTDKAADLLRGEAMEAQHVAFSPDGKRLALGVNHSTLLGEWGEVQIWDVQTAKLLRGFKSRRAVGAVAFRPGSDQIASASGDLENGEVVLCNASTGEEVGRLSGKTGWFMDLAFTPDGRRLATGGRDGAVKIWDAESGRLALILDHRGQVYSVAFSPNGAVLAAAGGDDLEPSEIRVWDATPPGE